MDLRVLSALVGLQGASRTGVCTQDTGRVMLQAIAFYAGNGEGAQEMIDRIHRERNTVSPDCAACLNPCGNTSDFEIAKLEQAVREHPALEGLLRKGGELASEMLAQGKNEFPQVLQDVTDCAAWDPSDEQITRLEHEVEEKS